jgi:dihydropyrimidinase
MAHDVFVAHRREPAFSYVPNGVPGMETRLALLFSEGVMTGRISIQDFAALTSTNAARLYGLYPKKGTIAIGSDADLVIWDTSRRFAIDNAMLHHAVDYPRIKAKRLGGFKLDLNIP